MAKLILVRHGWTDWNKISRIQGVCDIPLNEEGKTDALRIASELTATKIDAVYSSCLSRSYQTAEFICKGRRLKLKKLKELNEVNQGVWQGLCIKDIKKRYKKQYSLWRALPLSAKPPQGEGMQDAYDRAINTVHRILERYSKDQTVCVVTHELILSFIKCYFKNEDINNIWNIMPKTGSWEIIEA